MNNAMKKSIGFSMNKNARYYLGIALIIILALGVRAAFMNVKNTYHVDEAISIALTDNNWPNVADTSYKNKWISKAELDEKVFNGNIERTAPLALMNGITAQTAADVHPPLYYWLFAALRLAFGASRYALAGFTLNAILFVISCIILCGLAGYLWKDRTLVLIVLASFAFSSGAISCTLFLRMYELLQTLCLLFLFNTVILLFPRKSGVPVLPLIFLFVTSCLGLLTHYYFLFFIIPVVLFALVNLLVTKRFTLLLWSALALCAGLYLAYRIFPAMQNHLFSSYRAGQSVTNLTATTGKNFWEKCGAYFTVLSKNLLWPGFGLIILALGGVLQILKSRKKTDSAPEIRANIFPAILCIITSCFVFLVIALSAPYQTGRYVIAFFPEFILGYIALLKMFTTGRITKICALTGAVLIATLTCLPPHINQFHEDYKLDSNPLYLVDEQPVIIISTRDAWLWKNMLLYRDLGKDKKVYVMEASNDASLNTRILEIARSAESKKVWLFMDDYFMKKPLYPRAGYYGFFEVYSVTVSD